MEIILSDLVPFRTGFAGSAFDMQAQLNALALGVAVRPGHQAPMAKKARPNDWTIIASNNAEIVSVGG